MARLSPLASILVLLAGCTGADLYDRPLVSEGIRARSGFELGPDAPPGEASIPPGVTLPDGVTEDEAVALAIWNNAAFLEALSELGFARADLVQAGQLPNPVLSVLFPLGPKQLEFAAKLPLEILWLRPARIAVAKLDAERVATLLMQHGLDLIRDVRIAFAEMELARRRLVLAREETDIRMRITELFESRLRAGDASEQEASAARVATMKIVREVLRLPHEVAIAEQRLQELTGFADAQSFLVSQPPGARQASKSSLQDALAARPDLRAAELAIEAAGERAGLARWEILSVTGLLDANDRTGKKGVDAGPGVEFTLPLFNWNDGARAQGEAEVERAARRYVTVKHAIMREVAEADQRSSQAEAGLHGWKTIVLPALETAASRAGLAQQKGETSMLPVLDAGVEMIDARRREAEALADLRRARAQLERSVGRKLQ